MSRTRPLLLILFCMAMAPAMSAQRPNDVAVAHNLQRDGQMAQRKGVPVLIVFTRPDCVYCDRVIHYYLVPMQRNPDYAGTVLIRRLDITSSEKLVDFSGRSTTQDAFARSLKVGFAPTVMVFTPRGKPGAKPLVGLGPEDYYGGFLDRAIETARAKMHHGSS
jgi:thioredoxin-related protein